MKKTGIVLTVLMFAGLFSFLSITPREKAEVEPVKITKNIPARYRRAELEIIPAK